jgi:hypothetical protein
LWIGTGAAFARGGMSMMHIFHEVCCTEKPTASLNADTDMHTDSGDFARQIWNN